jgi:hypothetical protein
MKLIMWDYTSMTYYVNAGAKAKTANVTKLTGPPPPAIAK